MAKAPKRADKKLARELAQKAGIATEYHYCLWAIIKPDGTVHLYFAGIGQPDGPGHGHYVMNQAGIVVYMREPRLPRGPHNHVGGERNNAM